jgi:ribose/xylose/arabinose/galactoside ABC-type transport system permease subunit
LNGILLVLLRIPSFIITLGSYNLIYGISLLVSNAVSYDPAYPPEGYNVDPGELDFFRGLTSQFGTHQLSGEVFWVIGFALAVGYLLHNSLFGFRLFAIGGNPVASYLAKLPVSKYKIWVFVICGLLSSAAGILDFSFIQTTQPDLGLSKTFPVFASVVIGGASLTGGRGTVLGTLGGALLLSELQTGLALLTLGPYAQQLFLGFITVGAVTLDVALTTLRERRAG